MNQNIFKELLNAIKTGLTGSGEFKWIDIDQGQIDTPDNQYPIDLPAALIDVGDIEFENVGNDTQVGDCTIRIRIALDVPENLNHITPADSFQNGLDRFGLVVDVYDLIENLNITSENFTRFTRRRQYAEKRDDRLKVVVLEFNTSIWDVRTSKKSYTTEDSPDGTFNLGMTM